MASEGRGGSDRRSDAEGAGRRADAGNPDRGSGAGDAGRRRGTGDAGRRRGAGDADGGSSGGGRVSRRTYVRALSLLAGGASAGCETRQPSGGAGTDRTPSTAGDGSGRTVVSLAPADAGERVSDGIFGRFAEHYGWEIYPGIYAEYVANNSFHRWNAGGRPRLLYDPATLADHEGVVTPWEPYPEEPGPGVELERPGGGVHGGEDARYQRIAVSGAEGGVAQRIVLPDYRTTACELSVSVRGDIDEATARLAAPDGDVLAAGTLPVAERWERRTVELALEEPSASTYVAGAAARVATPYGEYVLEFVAEGDGHVDLDWVTLTPGDAVEGAFNPTTIDLMRDRNVTTLKWPGGNFTSQYDWRDGVGPVAERPVRPNRAWGGLEPNFFGTDEYLAFCDLVDVEPTITVGASSEVGAGTAAAWVEYCNGSTDTEMGALRAEHGHPEPYGVELWEVGNEVYGPWQIGHTPDPSVFAERFNEYYDAMTAVDDSITVLADGMDPMYREPNTPDPGAWNAALFERSGDRLSGLDVHRYNWGIREPDERSAWIEEGREPLDYSEVLVMFPTQFGRLMAELAGDAADAGVEPFQVFVGEWGLFPAVGPGWPWPGMPTMAGASYVAGMYNAFIRQCEHVRRAAHTHVPVRMFPPEYADYPPDPNPLLPTGRAMKLYAEVFREDADWRQVPAAVEGAGRTIPETGHRIRRAEDVPYVDAAAVRSGDGDELCAFATNRNLRAEARVDLSLPEDFAGRTAAVTVQRPTGDPHAQQTSLGDAPGAWLDWEGLDAYEVVATERAVDDDGTLALTLESAAIARVRIS